jgi:hypothetical protein
MHDTWLILRWAWSAVVIVYCVLAIVASSKLHGDAKKRSRNILIVMAVLIATRIWIRQVFGAGLAYRFSVVVVGIAAGIAALIVAKMLITREPSDEDEAASLTDGKSGIQSLKLN